MRGDYRHGNCEPESLSTRGRLLSHRFGHLQTTAKTGYEARPYHEYPEARFRAKRGFMLEAGVLPAKPMQTASAATPLRRRRTIPKPVVDVAAEAPSQVALEPTAGAALDLSAQPASAHVDRFHEKPSTPLPRRKRRKRHSMSLHPDMFIAIFAVMTAMAASVFWREGTPGGTARVNTASPPSAQPRSAEVQVSKQLASNTRTERQMDGPGMIAGMPASSPGDQTPSKEKQTQPKKSQARPPPKIRSDQADSAKATIGAAQKKYARSGEKQDRARRRNATAGGTGRADEINRLKAQAFSETRKDRLGSAKPGEKTSAPDARFDQSSARRATDNASQLTKRVNLAGEFNQCRRKESFLQREKCKWQICTGKWGTNGCPAYKHDIASY